GSGARELLRLGEFLDNPVALELREVVDEQHAVQMIDLVLDASGKDAGTVHLLALAGTIEETDSYLLRTSHHVEEFGDGKAAFLIVGLLFARPDDFRIDEKNRRPLLAVLGEIDHYEAQRYADLDGCKPDTRRVIHGIEHVIEDAAGIIAHMSQGLGYLPQHGIGQLDDVADGHAVHLSDGHRRVNRGARIAATGCGHPDAR